MVRDWDLMRRILLAVATAPPQTPLNAEAFPGEDADRLFEHVQLLKEAGCIAAELVPPTPDQGSGTFRIERLVWEGPSCWLR